MPLPFILAGAAIAAAGYGVKKGIDAKDDFDRADRLNEEAQEIFEESESRLEQRRDDAQKALNTLGKLKFEAYESSVIPFVDTFKQIKNLNLNDHNITDEASNFKITSEEMASMNKSAMTMKEVVGGGVTALGTGGLAGLAAYGGVGMLGTASTGAGIAGLSGVAATNATLAWLGGGSLAAGGLGVAGGTAILGGIVAGPVLAVGGMMLASKAEEAKENAYANLENAELAAEEMKSAGVAAKGIQKRFTELHNILNELLKVFTPLLSNLQQLVAYNKDYNSYGEADKKGVYICTQLAVTIKNLLEAPVLDESGKAINKTKKMFDKAHAEFC